MNAILVTLAATFLVQLGYFLWKVSANSEQPKIGREPLFMVLRGLLTDWKYVLGWLTLSVGWLLFVYATSLGDISLIQPLMSAGELLIVVFAVLFLHERLNSKEWVGVLVSVIGSIALIWNVEETLSVSPSRIGLVGIISGMIVAGAILLYLSRRSRHSEIFLSLVVGLCFGGAAILTKAMTGELASGISIARSMLIFLPAIILINVMGLILIQAAFQRGRAAVIVPLQVSVTNAVTVLAGILIFSEHVTLLRFVGIALIVSRTLFIRIEE